jgi:hypothetical protein
MTRQGTSSGSMKGLPSRSDPSGVEWGRKGCWVVRGGEVSGSNQWNRGSVVDRVGLGDFRG